jgi:23S rRNA (uracil1939-C5)-methyltransferase
MQQPETNRRQEDRREATIEKWVYGGRGLGRVNGQTLLVPYVLAGEVVRVAIERERGGLLEGKLMDVLTPSSRRVSPPCQYFTRCGGCHYQHAPYESQLAGKVDVLRETLRRVGKMEAPEEIGILSASPIEYRNRVQFHLAGGEIGFLEAGSSRLCPVERCPISSPAINSALAVLRKMTGDRRFPSFIRSIELFSNESEVQVNILESERPIARHFFDWCAEGMPGAAAGSLEYAAVGAIFRVGHRSFFQVNRFLIDKLVEAALGDADGGSAVDLYAGVGLFSIPLARRFQSVTAVESGASATRDLEFNTARAGVSVRAERATTEMYLEGLERAPDFVLADPPRSGLGKGAVRQLLRLLPRRITIVACDPATLARDLGPLLQAGYRCAGMTLIDLFPQTYHIETITDLRLHK